MVFYSCLPRLGQVCVGVVVMSDEECVCFGGISVWAGGRSMVVVGRRREVRAVVVIAAAPVCLIFTSFTH